VITIRHFQVEAIAYNGRHLFRPAHPAIAAKEHKERKEREQLELGSAPASGAVSRALAGNSEASEQKQTSVDFTRPELPTGASATAREARALPPDLGFNLCLLMLL
jgi:hypothetical protein